MNAAERQASTPLATAARSSNGENRRANTMKAAWAFGLASILEIALHDSVRVITKYAKSDLHGVI